jgi:DNA-binding NtrC family response regulator
VILPEHLWLDAVGAAVAGPGAYESFLEMPFKEAVAALERALIAHALEAAGGNRAEAARRLGINRRLLYSKLEEHGLG